VAWFVPAHLGLVVSAPENAPQRAARCEGPAPKINGPFDLS